MNPQQHFSVSLTEVFASFWRNRGLIRQMTRREVVGRYRGSIMGLAWSFFHPILMLAVYTFVFSVVFKARWGADVDESKTGFAIALFAGMIVHGLFADCINRAPGLIISNVNFVKKVVFPLEIMPWIAMGSALFHSAINVSVLLLAQIVFKQQIPWTAIFFPAIVLPLVFISMGLAWFLAALGVYLRDISQITGIFTTILMFLSPVFFPLSALPPALQPWLILNPLAFIIEQARNVLIFGRTPNWGGWGIALTVSVTVAWMGLWWFQRTRKGFADVL
jgi:lipopolysaccharide transport system permease protein